MSPKKKICIVDYNLYLGIVKQANLTQIKGGKPKRNHHLKP